MTEHEQLVERVALTLFNRRRDQAMMRRVDYIGANNTPECNECREQARAAISTIAEALREPTSAMVLDGVSYRLSTKISGDNRWPEDTAALFSAMLSASPLNGEQK